MSRCRRGVWGAEKLIGKLKDFIAKVKAYFDGLTTNTKAEAALLKEMRDGGLHYLERIVEAYDKAATAAVENYQGAETRSGGKAQRDQLAIREAFADEIDQWAKDGKPEGVRFTLGSTGPVLQGLGAIESDIYMEGDKISTILRDHPEMTLAEIKKIPQILEDPALVLKSKGTSARGRNTRLVVFGSAKASNGKPVMSVLDLRPRESGFVLEDMQKVNSAYAKKNPGNFLTSSEVLYADKKRTIPLLRSSGLTIASRQLLRNGYIGSITYAVQNVNIKGLPFSSVVQEGDVQFSIREIAGKAMPDQTESQAQIRSSTLSDRDVLRIAAQMAKNSESRSLTDGDRLAPLNFGYHEAKHLIQSCFIQIETVSVLQCVLPRFLFRISIFNHQRHRTGKYTNSEERSICGNEKFFPAKINRAVFCRGGSFHFG